MFYGGIAIAGIGGGIAIQLRCNGTGAGELVVA